ncbi:YfiT family bacillithiol transferase [Paenibacillus sp. J22TS3]|uniref:YfiT family bacillithiol transferase n=1 Tax=Paenibacillus sp. J22TS3 TaxID=2807192 RepID=UPI001B04F2F4|nr:bacillithiol transferase BstA [Paenibacillus sp. J22TS3]GIP21921.1 putative metal-dependent hydrolase [Paenibacillus sp. J22TS3]
MTDFRYPIGQYEGSRDNSSAQREIWIQEIDELPVKLAEATLGLSEDQLNLPYREGGWTLRQVVHHLADSHMHAYTRFKLALTEEEPEIKPYFEERWSNLPDALTSDIHISLQLLKALHERWVILLRSMGESDYKRTFYHPELKRGISLDYSLGNYAWHGKHHTAHITTLRERLNI